jgi:hypothetical protein
LPAIPEHVGKPLALELLVMNPFPGLKTHFMVQFAYRLFQELLVMNSLSFRCTCLSLRISLDSRGMPRLAQAPPIRE